MNQNRIHQDGEKEVKPHGNTHINALLYYKLQRIFFIIYKDIRLKKLWSVIKQNRQVTYIAPLNRIPLLSSDPGGVL